MININAEMSIITVSFADTTRMSKEQRDLGFLIMEVLSQLLCGNNKNSGMSALCSYNFRKPADLILKA